MLKNTVLLLYSYLPKMSANFLFFISFGMILLERTSRYFFVSCLTEDQANLGSLVFVSAVSILWCARDIWFNIFNGFNEINQNPLVTINKEHLFCQLYHVHADDSTSLLCGNQLYKLCDSCVSHSAQS